MAKVSNQQQIWGLNVPSPTKSTEGLIVLSLLIAFIVSKMALGTAQNIPENVQEIMDSDKSPTLLDR